MRRSVLGAVLLGLVFVLAACGRVPSTSGTNATPSPTAASTPLTIPGPTMHQGEVELAYAPVNLTANGGTGPYVWILGDGALPTGLTLSMDGAVAGTPTQAGTFTFVVQVRDATSNTANLSLSIDVAPVLSVKAASAGTVAIRQGRAVTAAFASLAGGVAPYTYSISSGSTPAGTSLNGLALAGTPNTVGTYRFAVSVTDALGATASVSASYYVWGAIAFPPFQCGSCTADHMFDVGLWPNDFTYTETGTYTYTGGTPGTTPKVSVAFPFGALNGVTVTAANGTVTVRVAAGANQHVPGVLYYWIYVTLTDPATGESTRSAIFRAEG